MDGYLTVKQASELWNVGERRIQVLCKEGRIENTIRVGRSWLIPSTTEKPSDQRITTGEWIDYRDRKGGK